MHSRLAPGLPERVAPSSETRARISILIKKRPRSDDLKGDPPVTAKIRDTWLAPRTPCFCGVRRFVTVGAMHSSEVQQPVNTYDAPLATDSLPDLPRVSIRCTSRSSRRGMVGYRRPDDDGLAS